MPAEDLAPAIERFRHHFRRALRDTGLSGPEAWDGMKWRQTVRHYGIHPNQTRCMADTNRPILIPPTLTIRNAQSRCQKRSCQSGPGS